MAESGYAPSQSPPPSGTDARMNRDSIKKGFNDIMKFADVNFSRAKQFMTEKAGKAEGVTELDQEVETLSIQMDGIKLMTEKMLTQMLTLMQPNPNVRLEDWARTKLDRPKPSPRQSPHNMLGSELNNASQVFGLETQYGAYLARCGKVEHKIGESRKRFEDKVMQEVITPLKAFLEIDIKSIMRERKALSVKRLDLDARKASTRKAQGDKVAGAEMTMRDAQSDYDQQMEKVRKLLKKVVDTHVNNMGYLRAFMTAQSNHYGECQAFLADLQGQGQGGGASGNIGSHFHGDEGKFHGPGGVELDKEDSRKARMLYDYDAAGPDEISIPAGEMLVVTPIPGDDEYLMGEYKGEMGRLPSTYMEYL